MVCASAMSFLDGKICALQEPSVTIIIIIINSHWLRCEHCSSWLYCHFDGAFPSYPSASLCTYRTSRALRFSREKLLEILKRNLRSVGNRSFSFIAPSVWNSLPASLQNLPNFSDFKAQLKTFFFFFQEAFPQI